MEFHAPSHRLLYALIICFPKNHLNPWVKGIKLMKNSPSLGGSMNTHNIISKFGIEMKMVRKKSWCRAIYRWPKLEQIHIPWMCPRGPAKSFPGLRYCPPPRGKKNYQRCTTPPGFPCVSQGSTHGEAKETLAYFSTKARLCVQNITWAIQRKKQRRATEF